MVLRHGIGLESLYIKRLFGRCSFIQGSIDLMSHRTDTRASIKNSNTNDNNNLGEQINFKKIKNSMPDGDSNT